jgi:hypothetical protein
MSHVVHAIGMRDLPPARDFILSAGFAGTAAAVAAVMVLCAMLYASRRAGKRSLAERDQNERHHEEQRADAQHALAVARCWDRWWQVLQTAAIEPAASEGAALGLGPEVTLVLLRGLLREAEELGDDTLAKAIATYQEQLLLVLAQQGGPLAGLAAAPAASTSRGGNNSSPRLEVATAKGSTPGGQLSEPAHRSAATSAATAEASATAETPSATREKTADRRPRG